MGKIYSLSNFKGGCGKTSTTLNLGAALAAAGKSVLLLDNDSQSNLTAALGYTPAEQPRTLANLLLAAIDYPEDLDFHLQKAIIHTPAGIDLIAANRRLSDAAARLQVMQLSQYNAVGDAERSSERVIPVNDISTLQRTYPQGTPSLLCLSKRRKILENTSLKESHVWRLSPKDRGRKCLLLYTGCDFYNNDEVPTGLMDIRDGFETMIARLETELSKETRIIPMSLVTGSQWKEAA